MKVYMATTAYGFSSETPVCVSKSQEGAEMALTDVYPLLKKTLSGYDPGVEDKLYQAYVREVKVIGTDLKNGDGMVFDDDGKQKIWLVSTSYVTPKGLDYESPWGVACRKQDALDEIEKFYPNLVEEEPGLYLSTIRTTRDMYLTVAIKVKEETLAS